MRRLKDFFFGKTQEPETSNTQINRTDEEAGLEGQASAVPYTNRHPWGDFSLLQNLTPERLAGILNDVKRGECPAEYLELAQVDFPREAGQRN